MFSTCLTLLEYLRQCLSSTQGGYDLLAPKFEHSPFATPIELIELSLALAAKLGPELRPEQSHGLDLACGTGRATFALLSYCQQVTGVDFSSAMLKQAEAIRTKQGFLPVSWRQEDLAELVLPCSCYDRVVSYGAWGHILPEFRIRFLEQVGQSLKIGGLFVTLTADEPSFWQTRFWKYLVFDKLMHLRNWLFWHEFHMYYHLVGTRLLLDDLERLFGFEPNFKIWSLPLSSKKEHHGLTMVCLGRV